MLLAGEAGGDRLEMLLLVLWAGWVGESWVADRLETIVLVAGGG